MKVHDKDRSQGAHFIQSARRIWRPLVPKWLWTRVECLRFSGLHQPQGFLGLAHRCNVSPNLPVRRHWNTGTLRHRGAGVTKMATGVKKA
jgi:hypothetical protein